MKFSMRDAVDVLAGGLTIGVIAGWIQAVLGLLGVFWFTLRFINFFRVNVMKRKPWRFY